MNNLDMKKVEKTNIDETIEEIETLIKEHTQRGNVFTVGVLEKCRYYVSRLRDLWIQQNNQ